MQRNAKPATSKSGTAYRKGLGMQNFKPFCQSTARGSPRTPRRAIRAKAHSACMATWPSIELGGLWALWSKAACGWTYASVSSRPQPDFVETGLPGNPLVPANSPASNTLKIAFGMRATRPWIKLAGLWGLWSKAACGWTYASVSSRPQPHFGKTGPPRIPWVPSNSPASYARKHAFGMRGNTALNRAREPVSLVVKSSLWVDLCLHQLPTPAGIWWHWTAGDSLGPSELPGARGGQMPLWHAWQHGLESS